MIKLISVNIERDRHIHRLQTLVEKEQPDVLCLQEVFEQDFPVFEEKFGMQGLFANMGKYAAEPTRGELNMGVAILSKFPLQNSRAVYYYGSEDSVDSVVIQKDEDGQGYYKVLVYGTVTKEEGTYTIGTTHFTWTPNGEADEVQRQDLRNLLKVLEGVGEFVLCGDFNAPRGKEIFDTLAKQHTDNIPKKYTTSIDASLHRAAERLRGRSLMVDGLFSTPPYKAQNVRFERGVSDHFAIVAEITT